MTDKTGPVVGLKLVQDTDHVIFVTDSGQTVRTRVNEISEVGRNTQGVKVISISDGERLVAFEKIESEEEPSPQ